MWSDLGVGWFGVSLEGSESMTLYKKKIEGYGMVGDSLVGFHRQEWYLSRMI